MNYVTIQRVRLHSPGEIDAHPLGRAVPLPIRTCASAATRVKRTGHAPTSAPHAGRT